jgi:hypothetical protein
VVNYEKLRIAINDSSWTAVSSPILAHRLAVRNVGPVGVSIRTDPLDPNTEDFLAAGIQESMEFVLYCPIGIAIFYARAGAGSSATLIVTAVN